MTSIVDLCGNFLSGVQGWAVDLGQVDRGYRSKGRRLRCYFTIMRLRPCVEVDILTAVLSARQCSRHSMGQILPDFYLFPRAGACVEGQCVGHFVDRSYLMNRSSWQLETQSIDRYASVYRWLCMVAPCIVWCCVPSKSPHQGWSPAPGKGPGQPAPYHRRYRYQTLFGTSDCHICRKTQWITIVLRAVDCEIQKWNLAIDRC